jgi:hypothetical protein
MAVIYTPIQTDAWYMFCGVLSALMAYSFIMERCLPIRLDFSVINQLTLPKKKSIIYDLWVCKTVRFSPKELLYAIKKRSFQKQRRITILRVRENNEASVFNERVLVVLLSITRWLKIENHAFWFLACIQMFIGFLLVAFFVNMHHYYVGTFLVLIFLVIVLYISSAYMYIIINLHEIFQQKR